MKLAESLLLDSPGEADLLLRKARVLLQLGWYSQAIGCYRDLLQVKPSPQTALEMAELLLMEGQPVDAVQLLELYLPQLEPQKRPIGLLARAYTEAQQFSKADRLWQRIFSASSSSAQTELLLRTKSEIFSGRLDVANALLLEAIESEAVLPCFFQFWSSLRSVSRADQRIIDRMQDHYSRAKPNSPGRRELCYALGKSWHDLGDYREAISFYNEANQIGRLTSSLTQGFDKESWRSYVSSLIAFFTASRIRVLARNGLTTERPLFIGGMIRSGTTLTEQILSQHSAISPGGETTFWPDHRNEIFDGARSVFNQARARELGQEFLSILCSRSTASRYSCEKNPTNIFLAGPLFCIYPNSKFLHVRRHPVDNLLSIWMTPLETGLPFVSDRKNLVFAYREYQRLANHLEESLPRSFFQTVSYEELTSSPRESVAKALEFLGLGFEEACLDPDKNKRTVRTPSFFQVRQQINTASQEKWRLYEPYLGEFAELL